MVAERFVAVKVEVVLLIEVAAVAKLSVEDSHRNTDAEFPDKFKLVEFVPEHTVDAPEIVPGVVAELTVRTTVSYDTQPPLVFVIVHRKVAEVSKVTPVTVDAGEVGLVIVAVPLIKVQFPVSPDATAFPANVKLVVLQLDWSTPANAVVTEQGLKTFTIPEFAATNQVFDIFVAKEPELPQEPDTV